MPKKKNQVEELVSQVEERVHNPKPEKEESSRILIPTGSTLLNLACSDTPWGGYGLGKIVNLIGDSSAGKTLLALTMLMEISLDDRFKDYELIYDDAEHALEFDLNKLFPGLSKRIILDTRSKTIQDFHAHVFMTVRKNTPSIYVLDSLDALTSDEELERAYKEAIARAKTEVAAQTLAGSYKTEKAKIVGEILRKTNDVIDESNSLLVIISQTRDKIGVIYGKKQTTSGGRALEFYSSYRMWLGTKSQIKKNDMKIGRNIHLDLTKNKLTGKEREVCFPVYYDYGVDDLGSCVDYLLEQKTWKKDGRTIQAEDFKLEGTFNKLIGLIEENNLEKDLRKLVGEVWLQQEEDVKLDRNPRFKEK